MKLRRYPLRIVFALFLLGVVSGQLFGDVSISSILETTGATLEWGPHLSLGVISAGRTQVEFSPGLSWVLVNYRHKLQVGAVTRNAKGGIQFTDTGAKAIEAAFREADAAAPPRIAAIVIDPGHGGKDPGTLEDPFSGKSDNLMEKNIVLKVGLDLYAELKKRCPDKKIVLTRHDDTFVSLEKRTEIANAIKLKPNEAKIFISIHANASFDHEANGYEVWYLPPTYERDVLDPKSLSEPKRELYPIFNAMKEQEYTIQSSLLGQDILKGIHGSIGDAESNRGLKAQDWFVVRNSRMPAVLVEVGFVTNKEEAKLLHDDSYLKKLAAGICDGIVNFITRFETPGR